MTYSAFGAHPQTVNCIVEKFFPATIKSKRSAKSHHLNFSVYIPEIGTIIIIPMTDGLNPGSQISK
jgi:hypothetical protein